MISTVIFDLDDVLCRYDLPARLAALSEISGRLPEDIHHDIWQSGFEDEADAGRYQDGDDYLAAFAERLKFPISRAQWVDARARSMTVFDGMLTLIEALQVSRKTAILTNNASLLRDALPEIVPQVTGLFGEDIYFSCDFGLAKPDPRLFVQVAQRCGSRPADCLFTDDKLVNVEGAIEAGMHGIHFTGEDTFHCRLAEAGIAT